MAHRECLQRLKDFRLIATRYDRLVRNYLAYLPRRRAGMVDLMSPDPSTILADLFMLLCRADQSRTVRAFPR
jgi:hypothetical protein